MIDVCMRDILRFDTIKYKRDMKMIVTIQNKMCEAVCYRSMNSLSNKSEFRM
jgi:hypothetical protein